jgi:DNA invertase Pin-like site-specific DNA recombinase
MWHDRRSSRIGAEPISERTRAGVKAAQSRSVKFGREKKLNAQQRNHVRKLISQEERPGDIATLFKVSRATVYRALAS